MGSSCAGAGRVGSRYFSAGIARTFVPANPAPNWRNLLGSILPPHVLLLLSRCQPPASSFQQEPMHHHIHPIPHIPIGSTRAVSARVNKSCPHHSRLRIRSGESLEHVPSCLWTRYTSVHINYPSHAERNSGIVHCS